MAVTIAAMTNIETVKAAALEQDIFQRYGGYQSRLLNTSTSIKECLVRIIPNALTTFNEVAIFILGFFLFFKEN